MLRLPFVNLPPNPVQLVLRRRIWLAVLVAVPLLNCLPVLPHKWELGLGRESKVIFENNQTQQVLLILTFTLSLHHLATSILSNMGTMLMSARV